MITEKGSGELRNRHTTEIGWPGRLWPNPPPNSYDRSSQKMTLAQSAATIFTCTAGYTVLGALLFWRAGRRMRKNIF
jgi:hypothetical protein